VNDQGKPVLYIGASIALVLIVASVWIMTNRKELPSRAGDASSTFDDGSYRARILEINETSDDSSGYTIKFRHVTKTIPEESHIEEQIDVVPISADANIILKGKSEAMTADLKRRVDMAMYEPMFMITVHGGEVVKVEEQ
jgi:hypothetical protein